MNLYLISQTVNSDYDTYDSAIVAADSEQEAKETQVGTYGNYGTWAAPELVSVQLIGTADESIKKGIILASFNAG